VPENVQEALTDPEEESDTVDFKRGFDAKQTSDWCELIKDIVAMANSGGGRILVGINDDGAPSREDVSGLLALDPADITNKIHKYTESQFSDFRVASAMVRGASVAMISVGNARFPVVFTSPGEYEVMTVKKTAFRKGTVYFRHGAKSEPGTSDDLRNALERELERVKGFWLDGIAKVVAAPAGSQVQVIQDAVALTGSEGAQSIRLTDSADGPLFKVVDNDQLYPYRTKELLRRLDELLGPKKISSYDVQLARRHHNIDANPNYSYRGRFGSRQYSEAFVEFLINQHSSDPQCFQKLRDQLRLRKSVAMEADG
jgi:hypothetical protein